MTEQPVFFELDIYACISDDEVARVLNGLKCDKATGLGDLLNEYFVKFKDIFQPLLTPILLYLIDSSVFPRVWSWGTMVLITIEELP